MAINGFSHYIQCIFKLNLICILTFFFGGGGGRNEKISVIMGVIIDKIFILIYNI